MKKTINKCDGKTDIASLSYEEAVKELEALVKRIENPDEPLDKITGEVAMALELVNHCRSKLREFGKSIEELKE